MKEIQFLIYSTPKEDVKIEAVVKDETLWLTQKAMAELFGVKVPAISKHLKNIFEEGELEESVVTTYFLYYLSLNCQNREMIGS